MKRLNLLAGLTSAVITAAAALSFVVVSAQAVGIVYGDVNCDGKVDIGDAVRILQSLGNPDVFALTDEGKINADVYNRGDGVTGMDSISVLKYEANMITELPESWMEGTGPDTPVTATAYIHLNGTSAVVEGDYADVSGNVITISHSGEFYVDGTLDDGQINVNIADETVDTGTVKIFLNGASITGKTAPAILITNAENTSLNLVDETVNTISDGDTAYTGDWLGAAVIEAKDDITIKGGELGTGALNITANTQDALVCNNDIKVTGGITDITTLNAADKTNAINGKTSVIVKGGTLNIDAEGDGLKSSKGNVAVENGRITIKAGNDAVQSGTSIDISGGFLTAGGDRGLTAVSGVNITGGDVAVTATDNQTDTSILTSSQVTMLFNCVDCVDNTDFMWKKANSFAFDNSAEFAFTKKYKYILISSPDFIKGADYYITNTSINVNIVFGNSDAMTNIFNAQDNVTVFDEVNPAGNTESVPVLK